MKKFVIATIAVAALLASCGVDKEGTADNLIKELEKQSGLAFTADQKTCVTGVVKSYSDDDLTALSEQKASEETQTEFGTRVGECLAGEAAPVDEGTEIPADTEG